MAPLDRVVAILRLHSRPLNSDPTDRKALPKVEVQGLSQQSETTANVSTTRDRRVTIYIPIAFVRYHQSTVGNSSALVRVIGHAVLRLLAHVRLGPERLWEGWLLHGHDTTRHEIA